MTNFNFIIFTLIIFISQLSLADGGSETIDCPGVQGLKIASDFNPEGKAFISKTLTVLYTSKSDDGFMTHIVVDERFFANTTPEILIDIMNSDKESIKKYRLNQWTTDKALPYKRISKVNFLNFMKTKLSEPYDIYANMNEAQKAQINPAKVPHDAKVLIKSGSKALCYFVYKYGSISDY
jgi:hypothetical protein